MADAAVVTTYDIKGIREDLADFISMISPEKTPFMSGCGDYGAATNTLIEWQVDSLAAPDGTNARPEGAVAAFTQPAHTTRVGNRTQISDKTVEVSRTAETVNKAGRGSEYDRQMMKRGKELKRDMETILLQNQAGDAGDRGTGARKLASLPAWLKTTVDKGANGVDPVYTSGVPAATRTNGTARAFTEAMLRSTMQNLWTQGAEVNTLMVGGANKVKVSTSFEGIATRNFDLSNTSPQVMAAIGAIDVYVSDFGALRVIPNRFQRSRDAWFLDWDMVKMSYLDTFAEKKLGDTGDFTMSLLNVEYTLVCVNEAGLGLVTDLS